MREEINEPQHWRRPPHKKSAVDTSWSIRRRSISRLAAEAVDAAFDQQANCWELIHGSHGEPTAQAPRNSDAQSAASDAVILRSGEHVSQADLVEGLTSQLALLEAQHAQLQRLLDQAQDGRS